MNNAVFSNHGEYLALSSYDGRLKLWETSSGCLKQEYTPSSHLSSTCTCLTWSTDKRSFTSPKKKRKKIQNGDVSSENQPDLIAMGTTTGSILLYSFLKGELVSKLDKGHSDVVNDVCWNANSSMVFSCSNDQHIVQWDIKQSKVKHKWKASRHSVYSICLVDDTNLISASSTIKWWNLSTREVIKQFTGHATEIFRLLPVRFSNFSSAEGTYFFSAAKNDRVISTWQLQKDSDPSSLVSFSVLEEIVQIDVTKNGSRNHPVALTALTESGTLHVFDHQLNGHSKKPLVPRVTIHISTEGTKDSKAKKLPILAASVLPDSTELRLIVAYGSFVNPKFEEISIFGTEPELWLIRDDPLSLNSTTLQQTVSKVRQPERPSGAKVLAPGHMAPSGPLIDQSSTTSSSRKRKDSPQKPNQLPLEVRLDALSVDETPKVKVPTTENLVHLLLQGLQSNNLKLLDTVLQRGDENAIKNTIRRLPITAIVPLLRELERRLHGRGSGSPSYLRWMKSLLLTHTSYLTTCGELEGLLGPVAQLLEGRSEAYSRMCSLRGRLNLMLSQISSKDDDEAVSSEALLVYNEESSDEEELMEDIMGSHSGSEDNWSDLDMELEDKNNDSVNEDSSSEEEN